MPAPPNIRLYYCAVHDLAQKLSQSIRRNELLRPGDRVGVAVSGGPDSVALLRLLLELRKEIGIVLSVVHVNHKLRGAESDADADFVHSLAREYKLQLHITAADAAQHAAEAGISLETAARELRYKFFRELLGEHLPTTNGVDPQGLKPHQFAALAGTAEAVSSPVSESNWSSSVQIRGSLLDKIATGHTLDDQAETVLMRIMRGTGMRGLRSIQPRIEVETEYGTREVVRPLLEVRRRDLRQYLRDIGQSWREDATNRDPKFTRNRVRHSLLPLLERDFNPAVTERLAELAEIARAEEDFWENEAAGWMGTGIHWVEPESASSQLVQLIPPGTHATLPNYTPVNLNALLDLAWLLSEPLAVQRRIVKAIADQAGFALDFQHVEEILRLAAEQGAGKDLSLPDGWILKCGDEALEFVAPQATAAGPAATSYELFLAVPGEVAIPQIKSVLQAVQIEPGEQPPGCNPDHLFDPALLAKQLTVRNWHAGDRFWPAHTKAPKKLKELLQNRHVPPEERRTWPVVLSGEEVIWVRGFPGRAQMRPTGGRPAVLIREVSP